MKKVFIKYNPYKLETEMKIDDKYLKENSSIAAKSIAGSRLQEWIEDLPDDLIAEYNDNEFDVTFHGTFLDYEDIYEVLERARLENKIEYKLEHNKAKETEDKEELIKDLFNSIIDGPFNELRDEEIKNSFKLAMGSDFEVCVVATMSAGKSTLINSMLGSKLMPSKQEACTAIITRIKDVDCSDNIWSADVYDTTSSKIEEHSKLTYETMERLNANDEVSCIEVTGDIPFVKAEDVSLILIDTPGPNNSRNKEHKKVQKEFLGKSSKSLVLYIMESTFGSDDDDALLRRVSQSMSVGGKQTKDRFIFVVNKMDDRRKEDGDTGSALNRIKNYLKKHGIKNPNLFPAAALPALNIRLINNNVEVDEDTFDETELKVKKLNRNENLHLEKYMDLPGSIKSEIDDKLFEYKNNDDKNNEALVHTGVISIEAAIRQYVQKYAKTAKIKNIVDTFTHKLDDVGCYEETKKELASNIEESEQIVKQINFIKAKINDGKNAHTFKNNVEKTKVTICNNTDKYVNKINQDFRNEINNKIKEYKGKEISESEVDREVKKLKRFSKNIQEEFRESLDIMIDKNLIETSKNLIKQYKDKVSSLTDELSVVSSVEIEPLKFIQGHISEPSNINDFMKTKEVEDGEEYVKNTYKKWYRPLTWFEEKGYYRTKYKEVTYIDGFEFAQEFLARVTSSMHDNSKNASSYAKKQASEIVNIFNKEFDKLDSLIKSKLEELESYATDKEKAEERIKESQKKIEWVENRKRDLEEILEI